MSFTESEWQMEVAGKTIPMITRALHTHLMLHIYRIALGVIFVVSSIPKMMNFNYTAISITEYDIFPHEFSYTLAALLIAAELIIAVSMLLGVGVRWGALLSGFLMVVFIFGVSQAWARGISLDCGCFGFDPNDISAAQVTPWTEYAWIIIRDMALLFVSLVLFMNKSPLSYTVDSLVRVKR